MLYYDNTYILHLYHDLLGFYHFLCFLSSQSSSKCVMCVCYVCYMYGVYVIYGSVILFYMLTLFYINS